MVGVRVMFGVVVRPVFGASIPVITKLILRCAATEPPEMHIHHFAAEGTIALLVTHVVMELSIWIGLFGRGQLMSMRVWW